MRIYRKHTLALLLMIITTMLTACGPRPVATLDGQRAGADQTIGVDLSQAALEELTVKYPAVDGRLTVSQTVKPGDAQSSCVRGTRLSGGGLTPPVPVGPAA